MFRSYRFEPRPVTIGIVALCSLIFLLQWLAGSWNDSWIIPVFGLSRSGLAQGYYWELVTHIFLHGNLLHLLFNMLALWFAGREMERILGSVRFLALFLLGGIVGGILQITFAPVGVLIGASGGVFAVLLAFTTTLPELPITALLFFILPIRLRAKFLGWGLIVFSLLCLLIGLAPQFGHLAHLGGALVGILFAKMYSSRAPWVGTRMNLPSARSTGNWISALINPSQQELDRILAKVIREGLHSLTPAERSALDRWSRNRS